MLDRLRRGQLRVAARPAWTNRIHRDDCAAVLAHLMDTAEAESLYLASDDEPVEWATVVAWLAERLAVPCPAPDAGAWAPRSSKRCANTRLHSSGYRFHYPTFREGYAAIIHDEACAKPRRGITR